MELEERIKKLFISMLPEKEKLMPVKWIEKFDAEIIFLENIYLKMDVNRNSELLNVMDEVILYAAIYKVLKKVIPFEEIRRMILEEYDVNLSKYEEQYWIDLNREMFSEKNITEIKNAALESQQDRYKDDYYVIFIPGKWVNSFGNNTLRCPIHIFCQRAGVYEFLKVICDIDFLRSRYMKSGLSREHCLCYSKDNMCTFRWRNQIEGEED